MANTQGITGEDLSKMEEEGYRAKAEGDYIHQLATEFLQSVGGTLTDENMGRLTTEQHSVIAYDYLREEALEGGFIQLLHNGYGPYVIDGALPIYVKKTWNLKEFSKLLFAVRKEYHAHRQELEEDMSDEDFMALYEKLEKLNDLGDDFLDDYEEDTTIAIYDILTNKHNGADTTEQSEQDEKDKEQ